MVRRKDKAMKQRRYRTFCSVVNIDDFITNIRILIVD